MADTASESPILVVKHEQERAGTQTYDEMKRFWERKFPRRAMMLIGLLAIIVTGYLIKSFTGDGDISYAAWFFIAIALLLLSGQVPKGQGIIRAVAGLIVLILVYLLIGDGIDYWLRYTQRCASAECSADVDYVPTYNGGVMIVDEGGRKTAYIVKEVNVPIPVGHCIKISPQGAFWVRWDVGLDNAFISPKSGEKTLGTIYAAPRAKCKYQTE